MSEPCTRLLLVDDHTIVRIGLATLFATVGHISVVGEATTVAEAIAEARRCEPDVVLMDVRLPDGSGVEACREIRTARPCTRVIMLTSHPDEDAVIQSVMAGAAGYLLKDADPDRLIDAVDVVAGGSSLLDPVVTQTVLTWMQRQGVHASPDPLAELTETERRVLPLIAEGKTNREIAEQLFLSEHTVKTYISNILHKLNLSRRAEAAAFIARHELQLEA
jgi:two-component system, NarL family, response regulator DevR